MSWWWRVKPRSIIKTIEWFPEFGKLEGKNWEEKVSNVYPTRREYVYNAHSEDLPYIQNLSLEEFISGEYDSNDVESNARQDKVAFEMFGFGYIDSNGIIKITSIGKSIINSSFDPEDYLKQLLKMKFPNPMGRPRGITDDDGIFPMQLLLLCLDKYKYLTKGEIALLFGCNSTTGVNQLYNAIEFYRNKYDVLDNKNSNESIYNIYFEAYKYGFGIEPEREVGTFYDYADSFIRSLNYTNIFNISGRGLYSKVRVETFAIKKFQLLLNEYTFVSIDSEKTIDEYMQWLGDINATKLPWNNSKARKELIEYKIAYLKNEKLQEISNNSFDEIIEDDIKINVAYFEKVLNHVRTDNDIKQLEKDIVDYIIELNEKMFINKFAKTTEARKEIMSRFEDILGNDDMSALWLEVNTWKSLLAIAGEKDVKRNFKIEENLTPRSFAKGVGNTPDMELYKDDYIIIPEVSLMTGIRQWEHEASSVIDHILKFIEKNSEKKVLGLFVSSEINIRTHWQFFILNRESWLGAPVPVVPLTIKQYCVILNRMYDKEIDIKELISLLFEIHNLAINLSNYVEWKTETDKLVEFWQD